MPSSSEVRYVAWQNRACRFYLAARVLHNQQLFAPAAFCATQALELLLKATLVYWDKSFRPEPTGHAIAKLLRSVRNKVPRGETFEAPRYFFEEQRYHATSRYPSGTKGIVVPATFLVDLDEMITTLVALVPFQHNTELKRALSGRDPRGLNNLRRGNASIRRLRTVLHIRAPSR